MLWNPDNPGLAKQMEHIRETAPTFGLQLIIFSARPADVDASFTAIANAGFGSLVVTDDPFLESLIPRIVGFAAERRLPVLFAFSTAVQQDGLMSYSSDFFALWRRAASYLDRILKGARPADLLIEQATAVTLKINLKTAKALGLTVRPTLVARRRGHRMNRHAKIDRE